MTSSMITPWVSGTNSVKTRTRIYRMIDNLSSFVKVKTMNSTSSQLKYVTSTTFHSLLIITVSSKDCSLTTRSTSSRLKSNSLTGSWTTWTTMKSTKTSLKTWKCPIGLCPLRSGSHFHHHNCLHIIKLSTLIIMLSSLIHKLGNFIVRDGSTMSVYCRVTKWNHTSRLWSISFSSARSKRGVTSGRLNTCSLTIIIIKIGKCWLTNL